MNPGLVVKLRPAGPWRIGPDSGARNRVDVIYHSDSLYSAVTSAMSRMGMLEDWLTATARTETPAVCFSSCFPFLDEIAFVVPPRTIWPPTSPALMSARVRWKSARFVPLTVVQAILSGEKLNANQWSVDGASGCLVPNGRGGPFRSGVRWNAAVDRLSGASERHATACTEFRPGSGLWTIVGFADDAARDRWQDAVKAAFRLLADTGFGGERSRGWGRAETPEFIEGSLPELIIQERAKAAVVPVVEAAGSPVPEPPEEVPPATEPGPDPLPETEPGPEAPPASDPPGEEPEPDPNPEPSEPPVEEPEAELADVPVEAEVRAPESIAEMRVEPAAEETGADAAAARTPRNAGGSRHGARRNRGGACGGTGSRGRARTRGSRTCGTGCRKAERSSAAGALAALSVHAGSRPMRWIGGAAVTPYWLAEGGSTARRAVVN